MVRFFQVKAFLAMFLFTSTVAEKNMTGLRRKHFLSHKNFMNVTKNLNISIL